VVVRGSTAAADAGEIERWEGENGESRGNAVWDWDVVGYGHDGKADWGGWTVINLDKI
jgi:hypothetical protein